MSFIDEKTAASFSAEMESYFDYFSRDFIVFKEPIKVLGQHKAVIKYSDNLVANIQIAVERA